MEMGKKPLTIVAPGVKAAPKTKETTEMRTTLGVAIVAAAMVLGGGYASATVNGNVHTLNLISKQASPTQDVYWRRWHHRHRHCWWRHGRRFCRWY